MFQSVGEYRASPQRYVYILNSATDPARYDTGLTSNIRLRGFEHAT